MKRANYHHRPNRLPIIESVHGIHEDQSCPLCEGGDGLTCAECREAMKEPEDRERNE